MKSLSPRHIEVLLIEDDEDLRSEIREAFELEAARTEEFAFDVHESGSVDEYHEMVKARHFDVLVVDIRLSPSDNGLEHIILSHHVHSPDTIIVVYSSFLNMDKVKTCVKAMKAGATDCIDKHDNSVDAVVQSVLSELKGRSFPEAGPSWEWLERNLPPLVRDCPGGAVAVLDQEIVARAPSVAELREMLPKLNLRQTPFLMVIPHGER